MAYSRNRNWKWYAGRILLVLVVVWFIALGYHFLAGLTIE